MWSIYSTCALHNVEYTQALEYSIIWSILNHTKSGLESSTDTCIGRLPNHVAKVLVQYNIVSHNRAKS